MSSKSIGLSDELHNYLLSVSLREPEVLQRLRKETAALENSGMQISPEQGQFLRFLVELIGATNTLEVGVFTGYSSLSVALALPNGGQIIACDVSETYTNIARRYWAEADVADRISLRLGPAVETLQQLVDGGQSGRFDFAFIDADKSNYDNYLELCYQLLRPGGLLAIDNVLWGGSVIDSNQQDEDTAAIRALNKRLHHDNRFAISLVPIGDGLTLLRKL